MALSILASGDSDGVLPLILVRRLIEIGYYFCNCSDLLERGLKSSELGAMRCCLSGRKISNNLKHYLQ
jgi:hypothetical protein